MAGEVIGVVGAVAAESFKAAVPAAAEGVKAGVQAAATVLPEVAAAGARGTLEAASETVAVGAQVAGNMASSLPQIAQEATGIISEAQGVIGETLVAGSIVEGAIGTASPEVGSLTSAMEGLLSEGVEPSIVMAGFAEDVIPANGVVPKDMVAREAQSLSNMGSTELDSFLQKVSGLQIPPEMAENAGFREDLAQNLLDQAQGQGKELVAKGDMQAMLERSAQQAMKKHTAKGEVKQSGEMSEQDRERLEKLKRDAAIQAVKQQMQRWRQDVMHDKRLGSESRAIALRKVDRIESRLILQTRMKWDGASLVAMMAVAAMWLSE